MRPVLRLLACLIASGMPWAVSATDSATAQLQVSARVVPHVRLEPLAPDSATVTVTAADVANGYLDVAHRYTVRTNAPERVRLRFQPRAAYAQSVTIRGFGGAVPLRDEPVELSPPPGRELSFALHLRLPPGFAPGDYPSPVQVVALVD